MTNFKTPTLALTAAVLLGLAGCPTTKAASTSGSTAPPPAVSETASTAADVGGDVAAGVSTGAAAVGDAASSAAPAASAEPASPADALTGLGKAGISALASKLGIDEGLIQVGFDAATGLIGKIANPSDGDKKTAAEAGVKATADQAKEAGTELGKDQLSGLLEGLQGML